MEKQRYASFEFTLLPGGRQPLDVYGRWLTILYNSLTTDPQVLFDKGGAAYRIPAGVSVRTLEPFNYIEFSNPSALSMVLWIAVSDGEIYDNRVILGASGAGSIIPVIDVSNTITTYAAIVALPRTFLIDAAAAVNVGGGVVGIPVTSNPFVTGENVTITGTVNYNGTYSVLGSSGANQVNITATYVAEVFDGVDDQIGLTTPRSQAADSTRKELIVYNTHTTLAAHWGDVNVILDPNQGTPIQPLTTFIIPTTAQVFFTTDEGVGKAGATLRLTALRNT